MMLTIESYPVVGVVQYPRYGSDSRIVSEQAGVGDDFKHCDWEGEGAFVWKSSCSAAYGESCSLIVFGMKTRPLRIVQLVALSLILHDIYMV